MSNFLSAKGILLDILAVLTKIRQNRWDSAPLKRNVNQGKIGSVFSAGFDIALVWSLVYS